MGETCRAGFCADRLAGPGGLLGDCLSPGCRGAHGVQEAGDVGGAALGAYPRMLIFRPLASSRASREVELCPAGSAGLGAGCWRARPPLLSPVPPLTPPSPDPCSPQNNGAECD